MNLDFIYTSGSSLLVATSMLVLFGLLILGGLAGFFVTLKKERDYAKSALPDLEVAKVEEVEVVSDDDMQILEKSVFVMEDDVTHALDDTDSNKLMADIDRAKKVDSKTNQAEINRSKKRLSVTNVFKKKN